jgi:NAD(P)-dependent dehydrogenase (short-subunit alcohol dehydrogenase family)
MALDQRLIVITGGAGGIARETAKLALAQGAELLLIDPGDKCSGRKACLPFRPIGPAKRRQL